MANPSADRALNVFELTDNGGLLVGRISMVAGVVTIALGDHAMKEQLGELFWHGEEATPADGARYMDLLEEMFALARNTYFWMELDVKQQTD